MYSAQSVVDGQFLDCGGLSQTDHFQLQLILQLSICWLCAWGPLQRGFIQALGELCNWSVTALGLVRDSFGIGVGQLGIGVERRPALPLKTGDSRQMVYFRVKTHEFLEMFSLKCSILLSNTNVC